MLAEVILQQPFPGVELEAVADVLFVLVDEGAARRVMADEFEGDVTCLDTGLVRGIQQIQQVAGVLFVAVDGGEVHQPRRGEGLPAFDQFLMQRVELVGLRVDVVEPLPLHHAGFQQAGGRVGVVLQHFRLPLAVPGEIEAAIQARVLPPP